MAGAMKRLDPQVGREGRGMSAGKTHRSLKRLLSSAAVLSLFVTGAVHSVQTASATDWSIDFGTAAASTLVGQGVSSTNNAKIIPTTGSSIGGSTYVSGTNFSVSGGVAIGSGDTNLGTGNEIILTGPASTQGTFFSVFDWTPSKTYDARLANLISHFDLNEAD